MDYKDYYKILGVSKSADEKTIKKAYRKLARQYHPDHNPNNPAAEDKFKDVNEAYEVLGDSENRTKYDQLGANYHRWKQSGGAQGGFDPFGGMGGMGGMGGGSGNIADILAQMFGGGGAQPGGRTQPLRQDSEQDIDITLEEAYHGTIRTMVDANGERLNIKIPRGAKNGTKVRLRGKGGRGGDLYLITKVRPHKVYERDEASPTVLRRTIEVDMLTALLGGEARVETLKGAINLKIMPGTQGGRTVRLRGRGMPDIKQNDKYGALLATIQIVIPQDLSDAERALYEQLRTLRASDAAG
ncbi:MAG: DnaJ C-terminal domain-containing protein [Candidatus Promineifilaceae bacterium]